MTIDWHVTFYAYALVISSALSFFVFWVIWKRRSKPGALPLALLMLAAAEWSFTIALEATALTVPEKVLWSKISYLGVVSCSPLFFLFAYEYTAYKRKMPAFGMVALWVVPIVTLILSWTNQYHYLIWSSYEYVPNSTILIYHHGIAFWAHIIYLYVLMAIGSGILYWSAIRNRNLYRKQSITILCAIPVILVWNILYVTGLSPMAGIDLTPVAFSLAGIILGWGIYKIRLFDIAPVQRDIVLENLMDGIIILDEFYRIVDVNLATCTILNLKPTEMIGKNIRELYPKVSQELLDDMQEQDSLIEIETGGQTFQHLEVRAKKMAGSAFENTSYLVVIKDITKKKMTIKALEDSEKRNTSLIENSAIPVAIIHAETLHALYANLRLYTLFDSSELELASRSIADFFERVGEVQRIIRLTRKNGFISDYEAPLVTGSNKVIWVLVSASSMPYQEQDAFIFSFNDITARKIVEETEKQERVFSEALRSSVAALNSSLNLDEVLDRILASLQKVIPHDTANIMLVDENGIARVVRAHGYEVAGFVDIWTSSHIQVLEIPNLLKMAVSGSPLVIPDTLKEPGWIDYEGTGWVRSYIGAPILIKGKVVGYINLDSSKEKAFNRSQAERLQIFADQAAIAIDNARMFEKMEQMAIIDMLTGLYNRRHFLELAEREYERYQRYDNPFSIIMMDLDHFKLVNDNYGHQAGDCVLQQLSSIFASSLRKMDIPGRMGGEEFIIMLPQTELKQAVYVAERIRAKIEANPFDSDEHTLNVTASLGVATMTKEITSLQALISAADKLMYKAKEGGRNRVCSDL
jgi:diguanylate cyclase (GGDEF)-like protein/PAS domain S-box-containing protein